MAYEIKRIRWRSETTNQPRSLYVVIDEADRECSERFPSRYPAKKALERLIRFDVRDDIQMRDCMACERRFPSEGIHNRLCNHCRKKSHYDGAA